MFSKVILVCSMALMASAGVPVGYGGYGGYGYGAGIGLAKVAAAPIVAKVAAPVYAPQPYDFGYAVHNEDGSSSNRQEVSDEHNNKKGSYGYTSPDGIYRHVEYVADAAGFRAIIKTNEPGTAPQPAASTEILAEEPPYKVLPAARPIVKAVAATPIIAKAAYPAYAAAPAYGLGLRAAPVAAYGGYRAGLGLRAGHGLGYGASVAAPVYAAGKYGYY